MDYSAVFDADYYHDHYGDNMQMYYQHYIKYGIFEGRSAK